MGAASRLVNDKGGNGGIGAANENDLKKHQQQQKRINKKDISTLMVDPLSPLGPLNNLDAPDSKKKDEPLQKGTTGSLKRDLVDEIESYMNRNDSLVRCSSDATISMNHNNHEQKFEDGGRKSSITSSSSFRQDTKQNHFLSRSMTFGGGGDSSWLSSPNTK